MPVFSYKGFNKAGKEVKDIIDAPNLQAAMSRLKAQRIFIKTIEEDSQKKDRELFPFLAKIKYRISRREVGVILRQLGTLLGAGVSLDKSLKDITAQTENVNLRKILIEVREKVTEGASLSESLAEHPTVFPRLHSSLVSVGERTGNYESSLINIAELEDFNTEIKQKVQAAMVYPFIMGSLSIAITIFLLAVVVPNIQELYASFDNIQLPLITRFIIGISNILVRGWWFLMALIAGGIVMFLRYYRTHEGRRKIDRLTLRIPLTGSLLRKMIIARFAKNLSSLVINKVPLLTALQILKSVVENSILQDELDNSIEKVKEGDALSATLADSEILSGLLVGMISAGEASDQVAELMEKAGVMYEKEVETAIKTLTNSLEPLMMMVIGGLLLVIMLAIMLPMYDLVNQINF